MDSQTCKTCEHWKPRFKGVGECIQEGLPNASFWIHDRGDRSVLLTLGDFNCISYRPVEKTETQTL